MKRYLFLLTSSLTLTVAYGQTNVYHPFPNTDAVWNVEYVEQHPSSSCLYEMHAHNRSYIQQGDTVINAIAYNKLYLSQQKWIYSITQPPPCVPYNSYPGVFSYAFIGGLRNDSINKKVYYYSTQLNQECLLYDFTLTVGDSVRYWEFNCSPTIGGWLPIISIDSVLVGTKYHKSIIYNGQTTQGMVEGMGGLTGLLEYIYGYPTQETLHCFSVMNQPLYYTSPSLCGVVGVTETNSSNLNAKFFPNPFSLQTTLQTVAPLKNASLTVYNSLGQQVRQINNINRQTVTLHRDNLSSGLYYLQLTQDNQTISSDKLVITDN